jgi:hypothetical protein
MARIQQLPPTPVNQIDAGEVVERPASVIKELLENTVDAGSQRIDVEVSQGSIGLIRVVDNGCGIMAEDLPLAFDSHATSKLSYAPRRGPLPHRDHGLPGRGATSSPKQQAAALISMLFGAGMVLMACRQEKAGRPPHAERQDPVTLRIAASPARDVLAADASFPSTAASAKAKSSLAPASQDV